MEKKLFLIDGTNLTPEILAEIIENNYKCDLTNQAWENVRKSRETIHKMMKDPKRVVYGINTGFGNFADKVISKEQREELQINLVRSHSVGVGEPVSKDIVKRMILLRINTLAKGRSGIDPNNLEKLIKAFNNNFIPMIPEKGTVGASGDLAPLSHLALGMMGEGKAWDEKLERWTSSEEIMKSKKLEPIQLHEKEGLALINGTGFMCSIISEVIAEAQNLYESAIIIYSFALEVFGFPKDVFADEIIERYERVENSIGKVFRQIRDYFDENPSQLHFSRIELERKNPQNIFSHSIAYQFESFAGFIDALQFVRKLVTEEMNSATDNPLVFFKEDGFETDVLVSAGNFHGEYVAKASDFLGIALFNIGRFSESRIQRYVNGRTSKLEDFLIQEGGLNSDTSAALLSESKVLVKPASVDSISTSASQEDHVSMGGFAARKAKILLENIAYILGIELMCALQSIDNLGLMPSKKLHKIKHEIRKSIPHMPKDRYYGPEITEAQRLVKNGLHKLLSLDN